MVTGELLLFLRIDLMVDGGGVTSTVISMSCSSSACGTLLMSSWRFGVVEMSILVRVLYS